MSIRIKKFLKLTLESVIRGAIIGVIVFLIVKYGGI